MKPEQFDILNKTIHYECSPRVLKQNRLQAEYIAANEAMKDLFGQRVVSMEHFDAISFRCDAARAALLKHMEVHP